MSRSVVVMLNKHLKKIIFGLALGLMLTGVGCSSTPQPTDAQSERYRELTVEFATHQGPALRAGEDVSESEALYLESSELYQQGRYDEANAKAAAAVDWLIENGY